MKQMVFLILFLIPIYALPQARDNSASTEIPQPDTLNLTINHLGLYFEPGMTARIGTENILLLHQGVTYLEDRIIGTSWSPEDTFLKKSAGVVGRFTKFIFADIPINYLLFIGNHEYFGHGARYRELDLGKIDYQLNIPQPYGIGGGYANVDNYSREVSDHERIAIWLGGFETHNILNRRLSLRWIADGESHYQENILYLWSWQDKFQYIQSNPKSLPTDLLGPLNDPEGYVWFLNRSAGFDDPENLKMDIADLQKKNLVNLANPYVWYSLYSQLVSYMYSGRMTTKLPSIHLGKVTYLPSLRMSLTPFGPQYHLENYLAWGRTASLIDISVGDETFYKDWWRLGVQVQNFYEKNRFSLDGSLNIWNQPGLEFYGNPLSSDDNKMGVATSITGYYDIINSDHPISIVAEIGYKTPGYIQGYEFGATPILRFGFGIRI